MKIKNKNSLITLAKKSEISHLEGFVSSNPMKSSFFGSSYKTEFTVSQAFTKNGRFSAKGKVILYFPAEFVESYYPGKLYSIAANGKGFFVENGAKFYLEVEANNTSREVGNFFYLVKGGKPLGWHGIFFSAKFFRFRALCRLQFKRLMYSWGKAGGLLLALLSRIQYLLSVLFPLYY